MTRTRNPKEFERELHNIRINGGGDCPEMSVYAIREALLLALGTISNCLVILALESRNELDSARVRIGYF